LTPERTSIADDETIAGAMLPTDSGVTSPARADEVHRRCLSPRTHADVHERPKLGLVAETHLRCDEPPVVESDSDTQTA